MFVGTFEHALDPKGRVILPAKFRERLEAGAFLAQGLDGCLALYEENEFRKVVEEMQAKQRRGATERNAVRSFAAGAAEATPDRQGRITIPQKLRDYAGLTRDVVVVGALTRIEIWDATRWQQIDEGGTASFTAADPDMSDIGI